MSASWAGLRIAVYARFSTVNQREASLGDQVRRAEEVARSKGGVVDPSLRFLDAATSGATLMRPEFVRLMQAVEDGLIDIILTEDVSRMSRDLGDAANILKKLKHRHVMLFGIADGLDYSREDSFVVFGFKAMMAEMYLHDLRDKTKRGLEGRALAKRSTGGRLLGYRSEYERDAAGKVIGARWVIEPNEAEVVRLIFRMSAEGHSLLAIARRLNVDEVPVLRPSRKNRKKGWVASTVRGILHNETYAGRVSWGRRKWTRDPETRKRRYQRRTDGVLTMEQPELKIVDDELWQAVQKRLAAVREKYVGTAGMRPGGSTTPRAGRTTKYPFSGLLFCSCCDTPMVICGGSPHRLYRCGDVSKRGICKNKQPVQERHVRRALLEALQEKISSPWAVAYIRKHWAQDIGDASRRNETELRKARASLARLEQRLLGFANMWADGERSPETRSAWETAKTETADVRARVTELELATAAPLQLPSPAEIEERVLSLHRMAEVAPVEAREVLGRLFGDGKIVMIPQPDGTYLAKSEILPLVLIGGAKAQNPRSGEPGGGLVYFSGCAGRI